MTYRVTIICDWQTAFPGDAPLGSCHTRIDRARDAIEPIGEFETANHAKALAERTAKEQGWRKKHQPMRSPPVAWICPACLAKGKTA